MTLALLWLGILLALAGLLGFALRRTFVQRMLHFHLMSMGALLVLGAGLRTSAEETVLQGLIFVGMLLTVLLTGIAVMLRNRWHRSRESDKAGAA